MASLPSSSSSSSPPPPNPILSSYESFLSDTPLITRYVLTAATLSYITSFFLPIEMALINIPFFTVSKCELYRLLLSNFLCTSIFNLAFGFMSFIYYGKILEHSIGSTNFGFLLVLVGVGANVLFAFFSFILFFANGNYQPILLNASGGLWQLVLGVIAMECAIAPRTGAGSTRKLFFVEVPTLYYPLVLLLFFSIMIGGGSGGSGGASSTALWGNSLAVGIGYAIGFGQLDFMKLSINRRRQLETGLLRSLTSRIGWVVGPSNENWEIVTPTGMVYSSSNQQQQRQQQASDVESGYTPTIFRRARNESTNNQNVGNIANSNSTRGGGHVLGRLNVNESTIPNNNNDNNNNSINATRRTNATSQAGGQKNAREKLLEAAEKRATGAGNGD